MKPVIIAGPCMAESYETLEAMAAPLAKFANEANVDFYFKSSFDKANRTSHDSYRGPGMDTALEWFAKIKAKFGVKVLTDVHETYQVKPTSEVCEGIQIPAFLCRQTDLVTAAAQTGRFVNIKRGQFMSPDAMKTIAEKALHAAQSVGVTPNCALCERGVSFGYGDLVVDMRSFGVMSEARLPLIFDVTHSTQRPPHGDGAKISNAQRRFAPLLARSAAATGYLNGLYLEVHPDPKHAKSDAAAQLTVTQALALMRDVLPLMAKSATSAQEIDPLFF